MFSLTEWVGGEFHCSVPIGWDSEWAGDGMTQQPIRERERERAGPCKKSDVSHSFRGHTERQSFSLKSTSGCPETAAADWTRL